jgi:TRAP-type C4-dicarboxylate transport system permease small subunit
MLKLGRFWDFLEFAIFGKVSLVFLTAGIIIGFMEVTGRYLFKNSFPWSTEALVLCLILATLPYFGWTLKQDVHVRITLITSHLPVRVNAVLQSITSTLATIFCIIVVMNLFESIVEILRFKFTTEVIGVSLAVPYTAILFGFSLLGIRYIADVYTNIRLIFNPKRAQYQSTAQANKEGGI